jgi:hypothetical protein
LASDLDRAIEAAARLLVINKLGLLAPSVNDAFAAECRRNAELAVTAAAPLIRAQERAAVRAILEQHYLATIVCDHEGQRDNPQCSCSLVNLGWHPTMGAAAKAWIDHAIPVDRIAPEPTPKEKP